jgi:preprotein translocase subunit SecA
MGPIYERLRLSVGIVQEGMSAAERRDAYRCDVTYLTAKEAGFDLLRDGLALDRGTLVHRSFQFALVDEADSLLVDEARIPLVIAGTVDEPGRDAAQMAVLVRELRIGIDVERDEHARNIFLTETGIERVESGLRVGPLHDTRNIAVLADLQNALHAEFLLERDVDYIVRHGAVELVDDFTGRVADRRQWPDGLHGATEAKEELRVRREGRILNSITVQHFLRSYPRLCGMTATAQSSAEELDAFYDLAVVVLPTHRPCRRVDHPDVVFTDRGAKERALVAEIRREHVRGRPVLVGAARRSGPRRRCDVSCPQRQGG